MQMMVDIERWYRRCLEQLGCELSGDHANQIKDGLHLFVDEPDWLQYVLQKSGWFEHKAMVVALSKVGNDDISLTINNPEWVTEYLFLDSPGSVNTDAISFVYGERLSEDACQFLQFLGWSYRTIALDIDFGVTKFESTLLELQRGDLEGKTTIVDLMIDAGSSKVKRRTLTSCKGLDGAGVADFVAIIKPYLESSSQNPGHLALKLHICTQIFIYEVAGNLALYNKVAEAIEKLVNAGKSDGELIVDVQKNPRDSLRPKVIHRYTERGAVPWVGVTVTAFESQVRDSRIALEAAKRDEKVDLQGLA